MGRSKRLGLSVATALVGMAVWSASASAALYWAAAGSSTIGTVNTDGSGGNPSLISTGGNVPYGIAVDSNYVYWANHGTSTIGRANLDGTHVNEAFITIPGITGNDPYAVAVSGQYIYWADTAINTIGRANLDGTGLPNAHFIGTTNNPTGLAVDGNYIYWVSQGGISRATLDGSTIQRNFITTDTTYAFGLAVNSQHLYWTVDLGGTSGAIDEANLDGSNAQTLVPGLTYPQGVAADGQYVYWSESLTSTTGEIGRANLDGTHSNSSFVTGLNNPFGVAVPAATASTGGSGGSGGTGGGSAPANTSPPTVTGTALPGGTLTCNPGTWSGSPSFSYSWQVNSTTVPGATSSTFTLTILDEGASVGCTVRGSNTAGAGAPAVSAPQVVAEAGTLTCPRPAGALGPRQLGPLSLGESRTAARRALTRFMATRSGYDDFCLYGGWGIHGAYRSNRLALLLTGNPFYRVDGAGPGSPLSSVAKRLRAVRPLVIGADRWYVTAGPSTSYVLKVRHGIVQEIGIASRHSTRTRSRQRALLTGLTTV